MILISSQTITLRGKQGNYYNYLMAIVGINNQRVRKLDAGQVYVEIVTGLSCWPIRVTPFLGGQQVGDVYEKSYVLESWPQPSPC